MVLNQAVTPVLSQVDKAKQLIREFMLDRPETQAHAHRAVGNHEATKSAFLAVEDARNQLAVLGPIRDLAATIESSSTARAALHRQADAVLRVRTSRAIQITGQLTDAAAAKVRAEADKIDRADRHLADLGSKIDLAKARYNTNGGDEQTVVDLQVEQAKLELSKRENARRRLEPKVVEAGLQMPDTGQEFETLQRLAGEQLATIDEGGAAAARRDVRNEFVITAGKAKDAWRVADQQRKSLDGNSSNINPRERELRDQISRATGVPAERLPFVAELVQVRKGQERWQGPIERVLRGFALSMLVLADDYDTVKNYVDANNLHRDLTFHPVRSAAPAKQAAAETVPGKVDVAAGEFHDWIRAEVRTRFGYRCVEHLDEVERRQLAVTINGLVRHAGERHTKHDRRPIGDTTNWVLGFDNTEKKRALATLVVKLREELRVAEEAVLSNDDAASTLTQRRDSFARILEQDWEGIDVGSASEQFRMYERNRRLLFRDRPTLADIADEIELLQADRTTWQERRDIVIAAKSGHENDANRYHRELTDLRETLAGEDPADPPVLLAVSERFELTVTANTIRGLDEADRKVRNAIQADIDEHTGKASAAENELARIFTKYISEWKELSSDLNGTVESLPGFLAKLDAIEMDRLPDFVEQFRELMLSGPRNHLSDLAAKLEEERAAISRRLDPINSALRSLPYNAGTYLQLVSSDMTPPELLDFNRELQTYFALDVQNKRNPDDTGSLEEQYRVLSSIVDKLGSDSHTTWRNKVLDVRQHVSFSGYEYRGTELVDTHRSGDSRSGGQRAKLLMFVLAAALRYQLARGEADLPTFAAAFMDEAMSRADEGFTQKSLDVLRDFGFQPILATPNKMLRTFSQYVGSYTIVSMNEEEHESRVRHVILEKRADGGSDA